MVALSRRLRGIRKRNLTWLALTTVLLLAIVPSVEAQLRQRALGGRSFQNGRTAATATFDGKFNFCRIAFARDPRGDGADWSVDYPRADINLSIRLSELTKASISTDASGDPQYVLLHLTDPELFQCPFIMMTEVGAASFGPEEALQLRRYLQKGGFLWADDFWGSYAWDWWEGQLRKALPADEYPIVDLPPEHPLFHTLFEVPATPQIPSIGFWASNGGATSERGEDSAVVHTRAIVDSHNRIMVLMTHNTDFGDSFEREGDDPQYFLTMSVPGYAFGINTLMYAMTH